MGATKGCPAGGLARNGGAQTNRRHKDTPYGTVATGRGPTWRSFSPGVRPRPQPQRRGGFRVGLSRVGKPPPGALRPWD